jgi:hypothetical protein
MDLKGGVGRSWELAYAALGDECVVPVCAVWILDKLIVDRSGIVAIEAAVTPLTKIP